MYKRQLYKESDIVTTIKPGRIRWAGHVQRKTEGKSGEKSNYWRTMRKKSKREATQKMDG